MIPKDASLSVRYHTYIYHCFKFICIIFAANDPCPIRKWTISGVRSWSNDFFQLQRSGYISCVYWPFFISSYLLSHISSWNFFKSFPCSSSSWNLFGSVSRYIFITFIATCRSIVACQACRHVVCRLSMCRGVYMSCTSSRGLLSE